MEVSVKLKGFEDAKRRLAASSRKIDPVMRGALNTTVSQTRKQRYVQPMSRSIKGKRLNAALKIKRANSRNMNARIIPSSSGILVLNYKTWGMDKIDATRARIWVIGSNGKKVAAGFINPSSSKKLPWSTRGKKARGGLRTAIGPSAAYWFKQLSRGNTIQWINAFLEREFARRVTKELNKP